MYLGQNADIGDIGDEAVADGIEGRVGDDDGTRSGRHQNQRAAVDQPTGQRCDKGGDT